MCIIYKSKQVYTTNYLDNVSTLKEKTAKGLLWGGIHNGFQQLLNLCFGIILGRILSPSDYGMVGMLTIFSLIASTLQESGFHAALANREKRDPNDFTSVFWFNIGVSCFIYLILFFAAPYIAAFYHTPELTSLARYSFIGFVIASLGTAHSAWLFCTLQVKKKAIIQLISLTLSGITGIILALCGMSYWGLATQSIVYVASNSVLYWFFSGWRPTLHFSITPLKEMFGFSSKVLLTYIVGHINNNMLSVILGRLYTEREVGLFNQANKWTSMGFSTVQGMITSIAQPILHGIEDDNKRQSRIFRKMLRFTSFISFPCLFGLSLIANEFITIALTEKWIESAHLLQLLCIGGAFLPIQGLYTDLIISKGKSNLYMWNTIFLGLSQLSAILLCYSYGLQAMILGYISITIAWTGVWQYFIQRELTLPIGDALKDILPYMLVSIISMTTAHWITMHIQNIYVSLIVKIITAATVYILLMLIRRDEILKEIRDYVFKKNKIE